MPFSLIDCSKVLARHVEEELIHLMFAALVTRSLHRDVLVITTLNLLLHSTLLFHLIAVLIAGFYLLVGEY